MDRTSIDKHGVADKIICIFIISLRKTTSMNRIKSLWTLIFSIEIWNSPRRVASVTAWY